MVHSYLENKTLYSILRHHWSLMSNCHDLTCWILMNTIVLVLGTARGGHGTGRFLFKSPREPGPDYKVPFGFSFGLDSNSFLVYLVSSIFYQSQWLRFFFHIFVFLLNWTNKIYVFDSEWDPTVRFCLFQG